MSTAILPLNIANIGTAMWGTAMCPSDPEPEKPEAKREEKKSNHQVNVIRIAEIEKHPNADTLGIVRIGGYQVVVKLGEFEVNGLAAYIQPDSVVPPEPEFEFLWADKGFTENDFIPEKYRRITVRKFRKEWSEGMLIHIPEWVRIDDYGQWREIREGDDLSDVLSVTHYEPPEPQEREARAVNQRRIKPHSIKGWVFYLWFYLLDVLHIRAGDNTRGRNQHDPSLGRPVYDVEAYKNFPNELVAGEPVIVTEKIHGSNARYIFDDKGFHIGSRTLWKNPEAGCVWCDVAKQNPAIERWCRANPGYTLYGEVVPTQGEKFLYGCKPGQVRFFLFDILKPDGEWEPIEKVTGVNQSLGVFHV